MTADLVPLARVARAAFEVEQARLAELKRQIALLSSTLNSLANRIWPADLEGATLAGEQWQTWTVQERVRLNTELARLRVAEEQQTARLRSAFGKMEALDRLVAEELARSRRDRTRGGDF